MLPSYFQELPSYFQKEGLKTFFEEVDLGFTFDVGSEDDRGLRDSQNHPTQRHQEIQMRREDEQTLIFFTENNKLK